MNYPQPAQPLTANDAKLGGKYRMNNIRRFIALAYLLYYCSDKKSSVDYSDGVERRDSLQLNSNFIQKISNYLQINDQSILSNNPLLSGQFEYILVAMERVFCLGTVKFNNASFNNSKERKGGIRYPKTLMFSTNMFVLDMIISGFSEEIVKKSLGEWLQNQKASSKDFEIKITQYLTICSQYSLFRTRTPGGEEIIYRPIGIYEQLLEDGEVSIVDSREQAGTSSIYNNVLKEELNPWLNSKDTDNIGLKEDMDLTPYLEMLRTSLKIARVSESDLLTSDNQTSNTKNPTIAYMKENNQILTSIRTKPFILLAGISGTGKSRIVRKLAQASVTEDLQREYDLKSVEGGFNRWELHKPANFEIIQVKPNWHNSMDVVGYFSNIPVPHYEFTPFTDFIGRAWLHKDIPFFLCLDEMNLAPVEEYFAEFLSAIESRTKENGEYETDPIIKPFSNYGEKVCNEMVNHLIGKVDAANAEDNSPEGKLVKRFKSKGLTLPPNLIVMGTVNMDETTYSFSRKVLDRAMSIEMNEVSYEDFLSGKTDNDIVELKLEQKKLLTDRPISAIKDNVTNNVNSSKIINYLEYLNILFDNTPYKLGYRAANEAILYASAAKDFGNYSLESALDEFTLMKILSRIEGDESKLSIDEKDPKIKALNYNSEDVKYKEEGSLDTTGITILSFLHRIIVDKLGKYYQEDQDLATQEGNNSPESEIGIETLFDISDSEVETTALVSPDVSQPKKRKKLKSLLKLESMMNQLSREHFVTYWN